MSLPYIYMSTAQSDLVPWLASQTDILAHDWAILDKDGVEITDGAAQDAARQFEDPVPYAQGYADPSVPVGEAPRGSGLGPLGNLVIRSSRRR